MTNYCVLDIKTCTNCGGEGSIPAVDWRTAGPPVGNKCPACQGKGETWTPVPLEKALKELGYMTIRDHGQY